MIRPKKFHPMVSVDDTLIKKYNFNKQESLRNETTDEEGSEAGNTKERIEEAQLRRYGNLGFIYGLCSIVLTPIFILPIFLSIPGFWNSLKGLKAKRNGLAVAGLAMSIIMLSLILFVTIFIIISSN
jgi:hypothetical protein